MTELTSPPQGPAANVPVPEGSSPEELWLDRWTTGPTDTELTLLREESAAPDLALADHTGRTRQLSEFWSGAPALLMFWRHLGCSCGAARAVLLQEEWSAYREAGLNPVIVAMGDPGRARAYRASHGLSAPVLCDPAALAYRAYGVGHWSVERVLYDAPPAFLSHTREVGRRFQDDRRRQGVAPVDDPWRSVAEFVISPLGRVRLAYGYQYCEDFPDPRVLTTAARLSAG